MNLPSVETRSFHYSDNKFDKFWIISLENNQHTVRFGRVGTQGQQQTKEFPTAEKARQSYEKLIRDKMAKGYMETEAQTHSQSIASAATPEIEQAIAEPHPSVNTLTTPKVKESATINPSPQPERPARNESLKTIDLNPEDWFWATWRNLPPLQRPKPKPFNLKEAQAQLIKVTVDHYGHRWDWSGADISVSLSREEASFWLAAMTQANHQLRPKELAEQLATQEFTQDIPFQTLKEVFSDLIGEHRIAAQMVSSKICLPLINLFPITQLIDLLFFIDQQITSIPRHETWSLQNLQNQLTQGFQKYSLPYLTSAEMIELRQNVEKQLDLGKWTKDYSATPSPIFHLAAYLGCPALRTLVESWDNDYYNERVGWRHDYYHRPQEIVFGLENPELVQMHMRRLKLSLQFPDLPFISATYLRAWLAHTELSALDYVGSTILSATNKKDAEALIKEFASCVQAPEAAPVMLELMLSSKAPQLARQWLQDSPEYAIAGLIPVAAERGRLADAAIDFLRTMKRKGYGAYIQTCIDHESAGVAEKIRASVLDVEEKEYIPFDEQTTPKWLQESLATLSIKSTKKASWSISPVDLPPIAIGEHRLNDSQVEAVLNALRQSKLDSFHAVVVAVKAHVDRPELDAFAWKLFEAWLVEGAPSKENWAMIAVGLLGSDTSALKLAPLIRVWPGESQHQRAVLGLECLRSIGTDTALMQINGIAQKVKFKGIKHRAQECMEAIAQERGMSREQLEDRIVPDCDLDEHGSRVFDFGVRQFRFVLGAELKPMVKDADGKVKSDLPKPGAKDDKKNAEAAISNWKLLKKQVGEVAKIQTPRLEQAMVTGRRWQVDEFELLLVQHPLMTHLTQRLIWGCYDASGRLTTTFRVTEDRTYADSNDEIFNLNNGATEHQGIGIVHPLHLTPEVRSTWGELLSDYEIVQPFLQLGRSLHSLEPGEETALEITRFQNLKIPIVALVRTLENLGWQRGVLHDHGDYSLHFKYFPSADITAVVGEYEEVFVDLSVVIGSGLEDIDRCCFLRGSHNHLYDYPRQSWRQDINAQLMPLGEVDPVITSEVLKDLITVVAKAQ